MSNLHKFSFEKTFLGIAQIVDMPGNKKKNTRKTESSDSVFKRGETSTSSRKEKEVSSTMDKTNISNTTPAKQKDFKSSANNVYNYQKKSFAHAVKGNSFISKTNHAIQGNRSEAMCYDALRTLNKDSNSEKQTKNLKKSDTGSFPHTDAFDEVTMEVYIKVGCIMTLL